MSDCHDLLNDDNDFFGTPRKQVITIFKGKYDQGECMV